MRVMVMMVKMIDQYFNSQWRVPWIGEPKDIESMN